MIKVCTINYPVLVSFVYVSSDVILGEVCSGFIALKAKLTLVSSIQHHLLKTATKILRLFVDCCHGNITCLPSPVCVIDCVLLNGR